MQYEADIELTDKTYPETLHVLSVELIVSADEMGWFSNLLLKYAYVCDCYFYYETIVAERRRC